MTDEISSRWATPAGHTVVGVFHDPSDAERALNGLRDANFRPDRSRWSPRTPARP